jgi:tetratricopeptide (TPR) repeat protein
MFSAARPGTGAAGKEAGEQVKVVDVLDNAAEALDRLAEQPELELDGRLTLADTYSSLNLFPKAIEQYNRALVLARKTAGEESEQALRVMADVAEVMAKADVGGAAPMARQAAETAARKLGPRHAVTLDAQNSLGLALLRAGNSEEAERLYRTLVRDVRELGPAPSPKGSSRFFNNLAIAVSAQGRVTEAEELQREGLKLAQKEATPAADRRVVLSQNLAGSLTKQNKLADAEAALRDALDHSSQTVGPAHPQTISVRSALAALLEQRGNFEAALALRREQAALFRGAKDDGISLDLRFAIAELLLRTGRESEAAESWASVLADERAAAAKYPAYEEVSRAWWARANVLQGLRVDRPWSGPALRGFAASAAYFGLLRHAWGEPPLDQVDWPGMRFRLERWPPESGRVAAEGGLSELWAAPDPPPGIYLLSLSMPRRQTAPVRSAAWVYVTPWKLSLFRTDDTAGSWGDDRWDRLFAGEAAERRTESALAYNHLSLLGRGFGPLGQSDGYALSATTTARPPAGKFHLTVTTPGGARAYLDGQKVLDCWGKTSGSVELTAFENDPGNELKVIAPAPEQQVLVTLRPLSPEADRMVRAATGTDEIEADADRLAEQLSKDPNKPQVLQDRGYALARAGRFREASADLARAIELRPAEHWAWYYDACVLAQLGDREAYRKRCAAMLERFRDASQPEILERTGKACLLLPGAADAATCSELVGRAVDAGGPYLPFFQLAKGVAEYRRGRHADALQWLDQSRDGLAQTAPTVQATRTYFRAMALAGLGRTDESREALAEADRLVEHVGFTPGIDDFGFSGVENFLICSVARRESSALVGGRATTP